MPVLATLPGRNTMVFLETSNTEAKWHLRARELNIGAADKTSADIIGQADVKLSLAVLDDVNAVRHRGWKKLVAGAGFEPAIPPQRRDDEPDERCTPVR